MSSDIPDPDWTLGWRLRRSLEYGNKTIEDIAEVVDVHRTTISRYLHDEVIPRRLVLREWAEQTGVRLEWLLGEDPKVPGVGPPTRKPAGRGAVTDNRSSPEHRRRRTKSPGSPDRPHRGTVTAFNHSYQCYLVGKGSVRPLAFTPEGLLGHAQRRERRRR